MFTNIAITPMFVTDQDQALDFYTTVLGFEVHTDADLGPMRWLTVNLPGQPEREVLLQKPGPPPLDPATAAQVIELTEKGATTWLILHTDDVRAAHRQLVAAGAEITQEPTEQPYGTDMAIRDPFGNQIRVTQTARGGQ
ncbi:VOC family protein [Naumannella sp. ID2617S]|uniref:Glyoxalase n=1 Tax=Enemella dayhoffiae TaxID=2016507 RepID=A0A255H1M4_9ACTN|nr:VOC family protein [Enemella dayhoffiae]NNG18451.1 VOC family protein [Naumannella sp. ID2617S]OYO21618.1 glyoxalase [Enemella dayhoffiae]